MSLLNDVRACTKIFVHECRFPLYVVWAYFHIASDPIAVIIAASNRQML